MERKQLDPNGLSGVTPILIVEDNKPEEGKTLQSKHSHTTMEAPTCPVCRNDTNFTFEDSSRAIEELYNASCDICQDKYWVPDADFCVSRDYDPEWMIKYIAESEWTNKNNVIKITPRNAGFAFCN